MAVIAVSVLLAVWYVAGHIYNRHRGLRLCRWLEAGLNALGGEKEVGWIGSPASGARINIRRAKPPFRRLEITLLLENREVPLLWLSDHLRGRRDRVTIRGTLRSPERGEVEVASNLPTRSKRCSYDGANAWTWQEGPHGLNVAYRGLNGQRMANALEFWLSAYGPHLRRFCWRKQDPHINLQVRITGLLETKAETFLTDLSTALRAS